MVGPRCRMISIMMISIITLNARLDLLAEEGSGVRGRNCTLSRSPNG
jgi:hypothetical protein